MPELPEVESVRRSLVRAGLPGRTITRVSIGWGNCVKGTSPESLAAAVAGRVVAKVGRRAKYLLFPLAGAPAATLIAHLGMDRGFGGASGGAAGAAAYPARVRAG